VVAEGKRAMTVRVNDVVGVAGFALPGNYVDILVNTQRQPRRQHGARAGDFKIVLERILVLAIAQESNRDDTKPKVVNAVTLELTPEQVEKLDLARSVGTLSLVLRNQIDPNSANTEGATKSSLLDGVPVGGGAGAGHAP
jgi:pilus assembly protein CpaB